MFRKSVAAGSILVLLSGSVVPSYAGDDLLGALLGAAGGAALGSNIGKGKGNIAAIAVGTLVGANVGTQLWGDSRPGNDRHNSHYQEIYQHPAYYGGYAPAVYSPNMYQPPMMPPVSYVSTTYQYGQPAYCTEFIQNVSIAGAAQQSYGTACRQPDGSWQIQN